MTWKKTWFSYLLWAFYTFCVSILAVSAACLAGSRWGVDMEGYAARIGIACLPFIAGGIFYVLLRAICRSAVKNRSGHILTKRGSAAAPGRRMVAEGLAAVLLAAAGIAIRVCLLPEILENATFYELAKVVPGEGVEAFAHGALYYYLMLLHTVFTFVGNKWMAGIVLQILLQTAAAVLIYSGVRKLAGVLPALTVLAGMMLLPQSINAALEYSPDMLYLCLYGIGLLGIAFYMGMIWENRFRKWQQCIFLGLLGGYISFLTYTDVLGITLTAIAAGAIWINSRESGAEDGKSDGMVSLFVVLAGFIAGMLGIFYIDSIVSRLPVMNVVEVWERLYTSTGYSAQAYVRQHLNGPAEVTGLLCVVTVMLMGIPGFFIRKKEEKGSIWILCALLAAGLSFQCLAAYNMERTFLLEILLLVLAGIALQSAAAVPEKPAENILPEKELEEVDLDMEILPEKTFPAEEAASAEEKRPPQEQTETVSKLSGEPEVIIIPVEKAKKTVKYIENPLPLPKKHVKKKMGYKLELSEEKMDFDLEIEEDDDFDLL